MKLVVKLVSISSSFLSLVVCAAVSDLSVFLTSVISHCILRHRSHQFRYIIGPLSQIFHCFSHPFSCFGRFFFRVCHRNFLRQGPLTSMHGSDSFLFFSLSVFHWFGAEAFCVSFLPRALLSIRLSFHQRDHFPSTMRCP